MGRDPGFQLLERTHRRLQVRGPPQPFLTPSNEVQRTRGSLQVPSGPLPRASCPRLDLKWPPDYVSGLAGPRIYDRLDTMYAIFRALGKQFRAEKGKTLRLPLMDKKPGEKVVFD